MERTWTCLTSGKLFLVLPGSEFPPEGVTLGIPPAVKDAWESHREVWAESFEGHAWWLAYPGDEFAAEISLLAWSENEGPWDDLLRSWSQLLTQSLVEQIVAADLAAELVKAWDRLTFLYELTKIAGRSIGREEMLESIVSSLSQVIEVGDVFLAIEGDAGRPRVISSGPALVLPNAVYRRLTNAGRLMSFSEFMDLYDGSGAVFGEVSDLIVAPLYSTEGPCGLIGFINSDGGNYDANDAQLLGSVAEQIGALIEASQARRTLEERERLERELTIAAEIQQNLLPIRLPIIPGCEISAHLRPARRVGGDFYDIAHARTGEPILMLADVAGKGMPAAILTAVVHATFHGETPYQRDPAQLLSEVNRSIYDDLDKAQAFVTAAVARVDTQPLRVAYASAGHVEAAVWHRERGWIEFLPATGLPLGVQQFLSCRTKEFPMREGDVLLLYSDGITEAENPEGEVFGALGLSDIMEAVHPAPAEDQLAVILEAVELFCDSLPIRDDLTMVLVRMLEGESSQGVVIPFVLKSDATSISQFLEWAWGVMSPHVSFEERPELVDEFTLVLSELITNQREHAYRDGNGLIMGRLTLSNDRWQADLYDRGQGYDEDLSLDQVVNAADPPISGYGFRIINSLVDECVYQRLDDGRNHWTLVRYISGDDSSEYRN